MRYLSAVCFGLVAASAVAHAQTAGNAVTLYQYGVQVGTPPNPLSVNPSATTLTPTGGNTSTVTTGGTAVTVFGTNAIVHGARITNPAAATEPLCISMTVAIATTTASGTNECFAAGASWTAPGPLATGVTVNALTSGHVFNAVRW